MYRRSTGSGTSSLTLESAAFGGGRLTPSGAMLYVTDYLGSVRAVVNGSTGAIYKASDFSAFGAESDVASVQKISAPFGTTFRDAYTGKEAQTPDFSTGYTDFGARQYSSTLRRWMTPDPLSEKYYGISPYAFCADNPVNIIDADGEVIGFVMDVISVGCGVYIWLRICSLVIRKLLGGMWQESGLIWSVRLFQESPLMQELQKHWPRLLLKSPIGL